VEGLDLCLGGLSPRNSPHGDGTGLTTILLQFHQTDFYFYKSDCFHCNEVGYKHVIVRLYRLISLTDARSKFVCQLSGGSLDYGLCCIVFIVRNCIGVN